MLRSLIGIANFVFSLTSHHDQPAVTLSSGTYLGVHLPSSSSMLHSQDLFLGIPYAQPPLESLRFRPPHPVRPNNQTRNATAYGLSCLQHGPFARGVAMGEDCLTLNVVRPAKSELKKLGMGEHSSLPVLAWIHGGGFSGGSTSDPRYNLSYIVSSSVEMSQPIIAVSVNYRLSVFGFLASSEVISSGNSNLGLRDQRFALAWLQDNIGAFGGDSEKITVFGESAGAYSIGQQLLAYGGIQGVPFRAAIMQSGTALTNYQPISAHQLIYNQIISSVNCTFTKDTLECLRTVPSERLHDVTANAVFTPVIDGAFLRGLPSVEISAGRWAKVPMIVGSNTDEGTGSFMGPKGVNSTRDLKAWLLTHPRFALTRGTVSALLRSYPSSPLFGSPYGSGDYLPEPVSEFGTQYKRGASLAGDIYMTSGRRFTAMFNAAFGLPTFSYRFDAIPWEIPTFITEVPNSVSHYSEIPFVFSNPQHLATSANWIGPLDSYHRLATLMTRSWISFAVHLDPNYHGVNRIPTWLDYGCTDEPSNFVFAPDRSSVEVDDWREEGIGIINRASVEFLR